MKKLGARRIRPLGDRAGRAISAAPPAKVDSLPVKPEDAIAGIPASLRTELLDRFNDIARNFRQAHWEAATLNAGKFCEVVYSILKGRADGKYPERSEKPTNMVQACRALENADDAVMGGRALRIQIPRAIPPIYEIRNNRGTGHAGAEVNPNQLDAEYVLHSCQWILADLVRAYHQLDPATARDVVLTLTERTVPLIWEVGGARRVLDPSMSIQGQILVLLYSSVGAVPDEDLRRWTEYKNGSRFRDDILRELHESLLVHYDSLTRLVALSPLGREMVERDLLVKRPLLL